MISVLLFIFHLVKPNFVVKGKKNVNFYTVLSKKENPINNTVLCVYRAKVCLRMIIKLKG